MHCDYYNKIPSFTRKRNFIHLEKRHYYKDSCFISYKAKTYYCTYRCFYLIILLLYFKRQRIPCVDFATPLYIYFLFCTFIVHSLIGTCTYKEKYNANFLYYSSSILPFLFLLVSLEKSNYQKQICKIRKRAYLLALHTTANEALLRAPTHYNPAKGKLAWSYFCLKYVKRK